MTDDVHACPALVESSACQVALGLTRAALQPELSRRTSGVGSRSMMIGMHLTKHVKLYEPLSSCGQNRRLHKALPRSKARCFEGSTAQPERYSLSALDSAAIRADGSMELAIAKLQLERKLAEVAEHSILS